MAFKLVSLSNMRMIALLLCLLLLPQMAIGEGEIKFVKTENVELQETIYSVKGEKCQIEWIARKFGNGTKFGFTEQSKCTLGLVQQNPYRTTLLHELMIDTNNLQGLRNFFWGRLQRGDATSEYALRLTRAALKSSNWNGSMGALSAYPQGINSFVKLLLNESNVFAELDSVFAKSKLSLRVNGVENVIIGDKEPVTGKVLVGKYPIDCILTFEIFRK